MAIRVIGAVDTIRGRLLVDGSGASGRAADVGVVGDRIEAVGDLSAVADADVATALDARGHVVAPGFVDPHAHSDLSVLVDTALWSHLRRRQIVRRAGRASRAA